jgi:hypothetical protein
MEIEHIETPACAQPAITSLGIQRPVQPIGFDMAIAGGQSCFPMQPVHCDAAVAGVNIGADFARHINFHADRAVSEADLKDAMRDADLELHAVARLVIGDGHFARPYFPTHSSDAG